MNTDLLIMAAGMGSRFGGLKQAATVGENGQLILDYSVHDAMRAGFNRAVIIIRKDIEKDFREVAGKRIEKEIDVEYVFQVSDVSAYGNAIARQKPWGTGAAVLSARDVVKNPFAVINADDYYGVSVYKQVHDFLVNDEGMCMAGYKLGNTLSENGSVSRGICSVENGFLKKVVETHDLTKDSGTPLDTIVSMNLWGLRPEIFDVLDEKFRAFLKENGSSEKAEFFLPFVIDEMITDMGYNVKVLPNDEVWYGITYKEDLPLVKKAIKEMTDKGIYSND